MAAEHTFVNKQAGVKPWKSAGLILTYWCNCRCAICYLNCSPQHKAVFMGVSEALGYWKGLQAMAGPQSKVHLSGGEAFGNWPRLLAILQAAQQRRGRRRAPRAAIQ